MEGVIKSPSTGTTLSISSRGRGLEGNIVQHQVPQFWRGNCTKYYLERCDLKLLKSSTQVLPRCLRGGDRQNPKAKLTRIAKNLDGTKDGKKISERADLTADRLTVLETDDSNPNWSPCNGSIDKAWAQSRRTDADAEDGRTRKGPSTSWIRIAGAQCPLNPHEEMSMSADVQDMLRLEVRKEELAKALERTPTVEEWAADCGTSVVKLYARIGKGRAAKRKMVAANLPLVNSVAGQFSGRGLSHWELCQEGVQGLLRSAEKFDTKYNTKFSAYSFLWIWQKMSAGVKKFRHAFRISRTVYERSSVLLRHKEDFQVVHGRQPSLQELADVSGLDEEEIQYVARLMRHVKSADESISTLEGHYEKEIEDQDLHVPWMHVMEMELNAEVEKALQCLTTREQKVLEMRYGLCGEPPVGRAQVGLALDLSYESVRLIEKKALLNLRHLVSNDGLKYYLSQKHSSR